MIQQLTFSLLITFLCVQVAAQTQFLKNTPTDFETNFSIETDIDNNPSLLVHLILNNGSYVVSPFSKDSIYGQVELVLHKNEFIELSNEISESPITKEEFDPILELHVRFVRTNTRYQQDLKIKTTDDFQSTGHFWLLLEPQCVPYKIDYVLSQKEGVLEISKLSTNTDY